MCVDGHFEEDRKSLLNCDRLVDSTDNMVEVGTWIVAEQYVLNLGSS